MRALIAALLSFILWYTLAYVLAENSIYQEKRYLGLFADQWGYVILGALLFGLFACTMQ